MTAYRDSAKKPTRRFGTTKDLVEFCQEVRNGAEKALDEADAELAHALKRYEDEHEGAKFGTSEAAAVEARQTRDKEQARRLYVDAGKPLPEWLR